MSDAERDEAVDEWLVLYRKVKARYGPAFALACFEVLIADELERGPDAPPLSAAELLAHIPAPIRGERLNHLDKRPEQRSGRRVKNPSALAPRPPAGMRMSTRMVRVDAC